MHIYAYQNIVKRWKNIHITFSLITNIYILQLFAFRKLVKWAKYFLFCQNCIAPGSTTTLDDVVCLHIYSPYLTIFHLHHISLRLFGKGISAYSQELPTSTIGLSSQKSQKCTSIKLLSSKIFQFIFYSQKVFLTSCLLRKRVYSLKSVYNLRVFRSNCF